MQFSSESSWKLKLSDIKQRWYSFHFCCKRVEQLKKDHAKRVDVDFERIATSCGLQMHHTNASNENSITNMISDDTFHHHALNQ